MEFHFWRKRVIINQEFDLCITVCPFQYKSFKFKYLLLVDNFTPSNLWINKFSNIFYKVFTILLLNHILILEIWKTVRIWTSWYIVMQSHNYTLASCKNKRIISMHNVVCNIIAMRVILFKWTGRQGVTRSTKRWFWDLTTEQQYWYPISMPSTHGHNTCLTPGDYGMYSILWL